MRWVLDNLDVIGARTLSHLSLALPAIVASLIIAVPVGWLANRVRWLRTPLLAAAGLLYAVPSLPLLVVLPIMLGIGIRDPLNLVIALTLYGVALMAPAAADALRSVDPRAEDAANAMGYPPWRRFVAVELPLAGPVLLAGLRVVAVSTVSLVTVGGVLGIPSLGLLFIDGFQRGIIEAIVAGIVLTVVLALLLDLALVLGGRLLLPWTRPVRVSASVPSRGAALAGAGS